MLKKDLVDIISGQKVEELIWTKMPVEIVTFTAAHLWLDLKW